MTGFYRDGFCRTGPQDRGMHCVCIVATDEFLAFSKSVGNDLSTPAPQWGFTGLNAGDQWCLCLLRWKEALEAGMAPKVVLEATHISALEFVDLEDLKRHLTYYGLRRDSATGCASLTGRYLLKLQDRIFPSAC